MKYYFKSKLCIATLCLPLMLAAGSADIDEEFSLTGENLLKSSLVEFREDSLISENSNEANDFSTQKELEEAAKANQNADFFSHLQANMGSIQMPPAIQSGGDQANTWIPKFVWLGDVKKNDDLKCFAAFLIGSLADPADKSQPQSPGVFMTPVETTAANTNSERAELTESHEITNSQLQTSTGHSYDRYVSRRGATAPPPTPACSSMFCEVETGLGFLYFSGVKGILNPRPQNVYQDIAGTNSTTGIHSFPIRGRFQYNRTPIVTVDFGWKLANWIRFSVTMQAQQNIHVRTKPTQVANLRTGAAAGEAASLTQVNFDSFLNLYSIGGKLLFQWTDMVSFSTWSMSLYVGGSCAAAWQEWTAPKSVQLYFNNVDAVCNTLTSANISFKDQTFANFSYTGDSGLTFKPTDSFAKLSFKMGCKFIGWGAVRGIGAARNQKDIQRVASSATDAGNVSFPGPAVYPSIFKPIRVRTIYSWAPYIGFNWEF